jgi:hypothetical protein
MVRAALIDATRGQRLDGTFKKRQFKSAGDDDVVEGDDVGGVAGPTVGDVGFHGERVGLEHGCLSPVDPGPMAPQLAVDPEGLFAIR